MEKRFSKSKLFILIAIIIIIVILVIAIIKSINKNDLPEENDNSEPETEQEQKQEHEQIQLDWQNYQIEESEYVKKNEEEEKFVNESNKLKEKKNFDGLVFSDASFEGDNDNITFNVKVKNTTSTIKGNKDITIQMLNSEDMEVGRVGFFLEEIKPDEEKEMNFMLSSFYITTYDYKVIFSKLE